MIGMASRSIAPSSASNDLGNHERAALEPARRPTATATNTITMSAMSARNACRRTISR
jgi:hypothetical protein